jgi:hypothetical protein
LWGAWALVGALVVIALLGSFAVYRHSQRRTVSEPIAIPAGSTAIDEPELQPSVSASASAAASVAPRVLPKRKSFLEDPYSDGPAAPVRKFRNPAAGPVPAESGHTSHRIFGVEN